MSNIKLTNAIKADDKFFVEVSFKELKTIYDLGKIKLDIFADVPYIPLEDSNEIQLNIDKNFVQYNATTKELIIKDQLLVMDGAIRLINFIKHYNSDYSITNGKVVFNISCYYTSEIPAMLLNNK